MPEIMTDDHPQRIKLIDQGAIIIDYVEGEVWIASGVLFAEDGEPNVFTGPGIGENLLADYVEDLTGEGEEWQLQV